MLRPWLLLFAEQSVWHCSVEHSVDNDWIIMVYGLYVIRFRYGVELGTATHWGGKIFSNKQQQQECHFIDIHLMTLVERKIISKCVLCPLDC